MAALILPSLIAGICAAFAMMLHGAPLMIICVGYWLGGNIGLMLGAAANFLTSKDVSAVGYTKV